MIANIHAAKTNLSKLVEAAERGEEVVIARDGKPVARLVPMPAPVNGEGKSRALFGSWKDMPTLRSWDEWKEADAEIEALFEASEIFPKRG